MKAYARVCKEVHEVTTGPGAATTRPTWRRWLLAGLPWAAAGLLAGAGMLRATTTADAAAPTAVPSVAPTPQPSAALAPPWVPPATTLAPALELAVLAAARTTLGTAGLPQEGPAPDRWPLETRLATVSSSGEVEVATVLALVIERDDGGWGPPVPRAVAVPFRRSPAAVLGAAWPVPVPAVPVDPPVGRVVADPDPVVVAALEAAGWSVSSVEEVAVVGGHHLRVTVHGTPPGTDRAARHTVWLRDDPGGPTALPEPQPSRSAPEETP